MISFNRDTAAQWALGGLVILALLLGGSARQDVLSLILLRPLAMIALVSAVVLLGPAGWRANRSLILAAAAVPALIALQLVPLPPALWQALPGRELAVRIDTAAGLGDIWRPFSLVPYRTVNALFATALPLAGMLLALALPRDRLAKMVPLLLGAIVLSAVLGLLQTIGGEGNGFYLYRVTNDGSAVGLFANRNHNAMFLALLFPFAAATLSLLPGSTEQVRPREWAAAGFGALMIPFLLATQSRAGLALGLLGVALGLWTYRVDQAQMHSRRVKARLDPRLVFVALSAVGIAVLTALITRTSAIERLASLGKTDDELRFRVWGPIVRMTADYFPLGSGIGTFVEAFEIGESDALLKPTYLNHAHNDWLEAAMTGGVPLLLVIIAGAAVLLWRGRRALAQERTPQSQSVRRLGVSVVVVLGLASFYDYPLRVPSLALLFALGATWMAGRDRDPTNAKALADDASPDRSHRFPRVRSHGQ